MGSQYNEALVAEMARRCQPSDADRNRQLFSLVAAGDPEARTAMIEGNMSLVVMRVDTFIAVRPNLRYLRDDMTSAGFCGLVEAVNRVASGTPIDPAKITGYLSVAIQRAIAALASVEAPVTVSQRTQQLAEGRGKPLRLPQGIDGILDLQSDSESFVQEVEACDLFNACCACEEERLFLKMRKAGCTYQEIADFTGMSVPSVLRLGRELEARICQAIAHKGQLGQEPEEIS